MGNAFWPGGGYQTRQGNRGGFRGRNAHTRFRTEVIAGHPSYLSPAGGRAQSRQARDGRGGWRQTIKQAGCGNGWAGKEPGGHGTARVHIQVLLRLLRLLVRLVWKHSASAIDPTDHWRAAIGRRTDLKQGFRIWALVGAGMAEQRIQWAFPLSCQPQPIAAEWRGSCPGASEKPPGDGCPCCAGH